MFSCTCGCVSDVCGCGQGGKEVEVRWHAFQLNPNAPQEGVNKLEYYRSKFGEERTQAMVPRMAVS